MDNICLCPCNYKKVLSTVSLIILNDQWLLFMSLMNQLTRNIRHTNITHIMCTT